ncbi:phosphatidylinositol glycan anchor biosynthesis class U protein-like isoform X1 [Tripterygium wilfordii]|uniref:phosphatidylinositol glycan anchor biosynthesis class U protein-like isoform X1 n=1 Tax=Tripterygium wilfordii TaxID=458696 RepID=UPI0018F7FA40|nr:phosphatidylinositol glycan anchor biosynthesis class U protein-like isoform X1 [Tripterygium wilfordii]XP_038688200.1 phosphatidylinositol glycan anchor biosynthesis class U protein-like isoform X1 [Tripterygium wilfordii]XP_038688201.1 phosphatidylinositol glycan anchor biosynthesis class U protein-like isoform X1 [Tripterygium wilfordii]XP_038688202.1 phosphatidylinositol glycan anchor biosynthesis class U protein-like isoform X1 [Tripterygium wilfordii]
MAKSRKFWAWMIASVILRLILIYFPKKLNLSTRPEVSTPLTSLRRLAEGYWLKQQSMSPYAGSMYHGSPLLLSVLGPLTVKRIEGQPDHLLCSLLLVLADIISAILIRATGKILQMAYRQSLDSLNLLQASKSSDFLSSGDVAALVYLWNPLTIVACVAQSTSPIENLAIILSLFGACKRLVPLAAFGWVVATHLSLYPAILIIPVILLLGSGPDAPPRKLFLQRGCEKFGDSSSNDSHRPRMEVSPSKLPIAFSWRSLIHFLLWTSLWSVYVLFLCSVLVRPYGGLLEMFKRTYGFMLTVEDLSPNIGVLWYFFAEVFDFFRNFFLIVFHMNILFMIIPLAIRLNHRPCFLAFVYIALSSMLKSYPSVGDSALCLGLLALFVDQLADMQFSFFLFCGYVGVSLLSPAMHNLWIWRGTGNANFYFATAMAYACFQIILVVESVSATLNHDRKLRKLSASKLGDGKS